MNNGAELDVRDVSISNFLKCKDKLTLA
jgi:hypothetical protein